MSALPIEGHLTRIADALLGSPSGFLLLTAETGAGKSTAVPQSLLSRVSGKIIMLEPRRVAAVAIATRIATLLGETVGKTIGYRVRYESRIGTETRIEIVTEAILTRMLQRNPDLSGTSIVILDEFHERTIHGDLALAFLRDVVTMRSDLRVLVMSATIDAERLSATLGADVLSVPGRSFPVEIEYDPPDARGGRTEPIHEAMSRAIRRSLEESSGSVLAFLPGLYEIRKTAEALSGCGEDICILHGSVPFIEQKKVLDDSGARRVILSSSIAETSLTVPGVSTVVDSCLSRIGILDARTGMTSLVTVTESAFSAAQRAGRAGRTGPGRCVRLMSKGEVLPRESTPEILRADILPLVLECALWGVSSPSELSWIDPPGEAAWQSAIELLRWMDAIDENKRITDQGRRIAALGVHPRVAAVALAGGIEAAIRHAIVPGGDDERRRFSADLTRRLRELKETNGNTGMGTSSRFDKITAESNRQCPLLAGFPDRLAKNAEGASYLFPSGKVASLSPDLSRSFSRPPKWIVATDVDSLERIGCVRSMEPIEERDAEAFLARHGTSRTEVYCDSGKWNADARVKKRECLQYGKITYLERPLEPDAAEVAAFACASIRSTGLAVLPWSKASESFLVRARFAKRRGELSVPDADDARLLDDVEEWLIPFFQRDGRLSEQALLDALRYALDGQAIDRLVPTRVTLANGIERPLSYETVDPSEGPMPVLETRVQDLYGCASHPTVLGVPVIVRLLSPARRPVHITQDLPGFWRGVWSEVRKEMKGRYPKHRWPENPLTERP